MRSAGDNHRAAAPLRGDFPLSPGRRYPDPPKEPLVRVEASRANWCMNGEPVEVGKVYTVPRSAADALEFVGKARRC